jgi:hypothetical protein
VADNLALVGAVFFVILCVVAYFPLNSMMQTASFQSLSWGYAVSRALPLLLTAFALMGSMIMIYIAGKGGLNSHK